MLYLPKEEVFKSCNPSEGLLRETWGLLIQCVLLGPILSWAVHPLLSLRALDCWVIEYPQLLHWWSTVAVREVEPNLALSPQLLAFCRDDYKGRVRKEVASPCCPRVLYKFGS